MLQMPRCCGEDQLFLDGANGRLRHCLLYPGLDLTMADSIFAVATARRPPIAGGDANLAANEWQMGMIGRGEERTS